MIGAEALEIEIESSMTGDEDFFEIVNDQRVELPPMGAYETVTAFRLAAAIDYEAKSRELGQAVTETLFRLKAEPSLQRRPDAAFISTARWAKGRRIPRGNVWDVVPDLVVEVVSPTNFAEEILNKVREYFEAGVRRVWVIYVHESLVYEYDSPRSIRVLGREDAFEGGVVIPGFRLPLSELLEGAEESEPS